MDQVVADQPAPKRQRVWLAGAGIAFAGLAAWMLASQLDHGRPAGDEAGKARAAFEEATGIRVIYVAVTAGGGMLDMRYQVLDPDKALVVQDKDTPPMVIDEATGVVLSRRWMDHGHKGALRTAVTYHWLLVNSGGVVKRGSKVALRVGGVLLEDITVL